MITTQNPILDRILAPLPNVLTMEDGTQVRTADDWSRRRAEILSSAVALEYGGMPPAPEFLTVEPLHTPGAERLNSYRIHTGTHAKPFSFVLQIFRPKHTGACPVLLTGDGCYRYCNDAVIDEANRRGYAVARFNRTEFAPDLYNSARDAGIYPLYPDHRFSAISAWAWGYHRAVDALSTMDFVDGAHIAITGHSRGGKTVLLAGATDARIAYVNPNNSGAHGCGCYRYEQYEDDALPIEDHRNEKLEDLFRAVPYWMGEGMHAYIGRETALPHDMHFIKALVAPRCLLETNGYDDVWSNPRGSYQTHLAAKAVWALLGASENVAAWYRAGGHNHGFADFTALLDFIDCKRADLPLPECYRIDPYPAMKPMQVVGEVHV